MAKYDVFISYSSLDQKVAEGVCGYLESHGCRCFVAYRDIPRGMVWARAIVEAIDHSQTMVVVFSEHFNISEETDREIELAAKKKMPILTFRITESEFTGAKKYYLENLNWIDAFPKPDVCFGRLYESVSSLLMLPDDGRFEKSAVKKDNPAVPVSTSSNPNLKIKCDLDCGFYLDGEERLQLKADQLQKIPLPPGEYELVFLGMENPADRLVQDFEMPQKDKLLKVSLKEIRDKRLEKEAEEERRLATSDREFTVNGVSFKMIYVEGGTFQMRSDDVDVLDDMKPISVTLSSYHIGETPVTQALWKAVMGNNPSHFKGDNLPVENVSWFDSQEFIKKLNRLTGKTFRLPTEAEWEYAARGGKHHSQYKYAGSNEIDEVAWYDLQSGLKTNPVKTKKPNALGIYDMSGNVSEWCQDWNGAYSGSAQIDPKGPASGSYRVHRGGSLGYDAWFCRVNSRCNDAPGVRRTTIGFRLAL